MGSDPSEDRNEVIHCEMELFNGWPFGIELMRSVMGQPSSRDNDEVDELENRVNVTNNDLFTIIDNRSVLSKSCQLVAGINVTKNRHLPRLYAVVVDASRNHTFLSVYEA